MVFTGPRIGGTLLACGAAIGAFPLIVDSEYFSYIVGTTLALAAGLGIYWLWDRVRDSANAPYEPPQK
jgi:predicted outer membrane lipoprotein